MDQITTAKGSISGIQKEGYAVFPGIPYAQAPVGENRWRAPLPVAPWEGVYRAERFPNRSMQEASRTNGFYDKEFYDEAAYQTPVSEDCLYLNIWTPAESAEEKLPVAFWIHGGAFLGGFGHEKEFDGAAFCRKGVILVTINYRLGPLGFLAHPLLSAERRAGGGPAISGNYGILDQIAALDWVRENIAAFGGDPENITVFGQSAGCMSVQTLISSPLTQGKIARAILQSGVGLSYDHTLLSAEREGEKIAFNAGVKTLEELRALPYETLMGAAVPLMVAGMEKMELPFTPLIDGYVLTGGYNELLHGGKIHDIPYIVGSTLNDIGTEPERLAQGDRGKVYAGTADFARARLDAGNGNVWRYDFRRQLPGDDAGAFHSSELWYVFGTYGRCWRPLMDADAALSATMVSYWTNFMKTGDPNGEDLPLWRPFREEDDTIRFDIS